MFTMVNKKVNKNKNKNRRNKTIVRRSGGEQKIYDVTIAIPIATATLYSLGDIPQGINITNRIGRMVSLKSLVVKTVTTASTTLIGSTVASVRMIIFQDKQQVQGTVPLITDVINPSTVIGQRNLYFMNRFRILRDVVFKIDTYNPTINYSNVIPMGGKLSYASGLSTDWASNGIFVIFTGSNVTNPPNILFSSRLYFSDE